MSKTIEILLREDIPKLGNCGDVVNVASGYARNYLLPRRVAQLATAENIKMIARRKARFDVARAERLKEIEAQREALTGVTLHTIEKADEGMHLYGSVNAGSIVKLLAEAGHTLEERQVRLASAIKVCGQYEIELHIHGDVSVMIPLEVEPEGGWPEPEPEPEPQPEEEREERIYMPEESLNE
ncbi:MAG: 50S ribosomal protein L9 [Planctomycetota bacterium]|nr:50S ribosomal protein L9 [Planctomycetota bacterium]